MVQNALIPIRDKRLGPLGRALRRDLKTLAKFVSLYCKHRHADRLRSPVTLKTHDLTAIAGRPLSLCPACSELLAHAFVKRTHGPMHPTPACKRCRDHCYKPAFRLEIQRVMRYSGRELLLSGRLDYLLHILF